MIKASPRFQFDRQKFKEVILYVCSCCRSEDLGAVKLHKVLYFSDMLHFAAQGTPITGSTYRKRPFGPTSDDLLPALRELERAGDLKTERMAYYGYWKTSFVPLRLPEVARLNEHERGLLDEVIEFVCRNNTAKTISDFSHNRAWERAEFGAELPYNSAFYLIPTQVSEEAKEWASSEVRRLETQGSDNNTLGRRSFADFRSRLHQTRGDVS